MRPVPPHFQASVKSYDSCLRIRWSTPLEAFVLERRMQNPDAVMIDKMRKLFHGKANRRIKDGLETKHQRMALSRRYVAQAWLEALNDNHRFIDVLAGVSSADLNDLHGWIRASDQWVHSNYDGNPAESANQIAKEQYYEEEFQRKRRELRRNVEIRDRAKEAFDLLAYKSGSRLSMTGNGAG